MSVTLLVVLVPVCLAIGLGLFFAHLMRQQGSAARAAQERLASVDARMARATLAGARVIGSSTVPSSAPDRGVAIVELRLEVDPGTGAKYPAKARWQIDLTAMPRVQPGEDLAVGIDPEDPKTIYPREAWAKPWLY